MTLPTKTIAGLVSDMIAVWSAETSTSPAFTEGDVLLALWQSVATQIDYLQAQIEIVVLMSRAQTSVGEDLDSWMADFDFTRLPPTPGSGIELFNKFQPSSTQVVVPVGTIVQTVGGDVQYQVVPDTTQSAYSAAAGGYVLSAGQLSIAATIQSLSGGTGVNVLADTLVQFATSVPGIDTVTNPAPITNGVPAENDVDFRARFRLYLATLAQATRAAILAAASGVQQGLLINLLENQTPDGTPLLGSFSVIVDDGSGDPPASLLSSVFNAVDAARAFSVQPFVSAPTQVQAIIALATHLAGGPVAAPAANNAVQNAIAAMINQLPPGATLYASSLVSTALSVAGVTSVNPASVTINGLPVDLKASPAQEIRCFVGNITITNY
jgi:uncharacterized phage protein gp47/JayE